MAERLKVGSGINGKKGGALQSSPCMPSATESSDLNKRYVDITAMIRSLQRTEGMNDCFRRDIADCNQLECAWRQYCLSGIDDNA